MPTARRWARSAALSAPAAVRLSRNLCRRRGDGDVVGAGWRRDGSFYFLNVFNLVKYTTAASLSVQEREAVAYY